MYVIGVEEDGKLHHILAQVYWSYQEAEGALANLSMTAREKRIILEIRTVRNQ